MLNNLKKAAELREKWISFFQKNKHFFIPNRSLIPEDKSLLWVNSGISALKKFFLREKKLQEKNLVNIQAVIRTNDIENVGNNSRHLTFFEMLGFFSLGGYFKEKAISYAFEFLTSKKYLALQKEKLYVTVQEKDTETFKIWKGKILEKNIILTEEKINFWDMGNGPCGPNTEIFYDRGEHFENTILKQGLSLLKKNIENERYLEILNIVFSQFNNLGNDKYKELESKNIDTGGGYERMLMLIENVETCFDTSLFKNSISFLQRYSIFKYKDFKYKKHFCILLDHIRSIIFMIKDGIYPDKKNRGYILRKLIRRSVISALNLKIKLPFMGCFFYSMFQTMSVFHLDLLVKKEIIEQVIVKEETKFIKLINEAKKTIKKFFQKNKNYRNIEEVIFFWYETFGYPVEISKFFLRKYKIEFSQDNLENLKKKHSAKAKGSWKHKF